ncbi:hypothetical protein HOLleu_21265 [Holothuria leucospilota]|uniref:Uncharacterized protein n=1 Tax=Holothuria leucospilota TaxID=206669 RepID=A0A9Q1BXN9_HOLLE|nr:hypothetical protein HOLleu_21265 [Holothuria leucospilota]
MKFLDASDFISFVETACGKTVTQSVQFINCKIPDELPKQEFQPIDGKEESAPTRTLKILRTSAITKIAFDIVNVTDWERLNLYTGCWEKKYVPLGPRM